MVAEAGFEPASAGYEPAKEPLLYSAILLFFNTHKQIKAEKISNHGTKNLVDYIKKRHN